MMKVPVLSPGFVVVATCLAVFAVACQDGPVEQRRVVDETVQQKVQPELQEKVPPPELVEVKTLDELLALFDKLDYNSRSWTEGSREIPRLTFERVGEGWREAAKELPVPVKKHVFFRLMAPLVLMANEAILSERQLIAESPLEELKALAIKYKVATDADGFVDEPQRQELLSRVDVLPPSLVLAQAAEESGWACSRFTIEGNAFFGQWDFSGKGMIPKRQRKGLGNYGLARFDSPLASVEAYLLNINTHQAYQTLRDLREALRINNKLLTGVELAGGLVKYSERGQAYIDAIRKIIRLNKLGPVDDAYLSDAQGLCLAGLVVDDF